MRRLLLLAAVLLPALLIAPAAMAVVPGANTPPLPSVAYPGLQHLHYRFGPIHITPGQNSIIFNDDHLKPKVPGYITRFRPNLRYTAEHGGGVPRVDVVHLHHGVWIMRGYPTFAAGEEKTIFQMPKGYGYKYDPSDPWVLNYMIHNLRPDPTDVWVTYDIDFLPASAPAAADMTEVKPLWMDVAGLKTYPVFDALRGSGQNGRYTFPDMARGAQRANIGWAVSRTFHRPVTLIGTGGHLHPGGLWDDLWDTRNGQRKHLFRSSARYFEPAGAVSWDVSMTVTKPNWRVLVNPGDTLSISTTYDVSHASWYEVMGIMNVWYAEGQQPGAVDPFVKPVDTTGILSHGHLPENNNHGGDELGLPDPRRLLSGSLGGAVSIKNFLYRRGDLSLTGSAGRVPTVRAGQQLTFRNDDPADSIYHTITACRAPCNRGTGVAYPIANGPVTFDSGELGTGPSFATAASNRLTWKTPKNLKPGTYTYFCRIHPFMRGAFRVIHGSA